MSRFLRHEACEKCGSKDNKAVFDDGHTFCFGCRNTTGKKTNLKTVHENTINKYPEIFNLFPSDASEYIPSEPLRWLLKNGVGYKEIAAFGIKWSQYRQLLCWNIKNQEGKLLGWQGRYFAKDAKTKYISHGKIHEDLCIIGTQRPIGFCDDGETRVVLVEDYISGIRVSEHLPCMPLFGCTCSLEALGAIKKRFNTILVWLDSDKLDNARKIALKASMIGLEGKVVYTLKDPKEYISSEIKEFLNVF